MKKIIISGVILTLSALSAQAVPDGMPNFGAGNFSPAMAPGAFGAYEMQLMKDQRQRQYIDEDFKLYQKKKKLEETGEVDTDIINDERLDLQSGSGDNNTFIKRVRNRSKSNPDYVKNNGKVIVKEERDPNAREIKVREESAAAETNTENSTTPVFQRKQTDSTAAEKPVSDITETTTPSAATPEQTDGSTPPAAPDADAKPQIKEDSLSSSSTYNKPLIKQQKAKPWLDEISPDAPTVEPASFEDNFDAN